MGSRHLILGGLQHLFPSPKSLTFPLGEYFPQSTQSQFIVNTSNLCFPRKGVPHRLPAPGRSLCWKLPSTAPIQSGDGHPTNETLSWDSVLSRSKGGGRTGVPLANQQLAIREALKAAPKERRGHPASRQLVLAVCILLSILRPPERSHFKLPSFFTLAQLAFS